VARTSSAAAAACTCGSSWSTATTSDPAEAPPGPRLLPFAAAVPWGLLAALAPAPYRERIGAARALDIPRWSFGVGLVQLGAGGILFLLGGLAWMRGASGAMSVSSTGSPG
jgi:hypothetical protein